MKKLFYIILTALFFLACGKGEDSDITGAGSSSGESFSNINVTRNSSTLNSGSSEINLGTVRANEEGNSAEIEISNNGNINLSVTEIQITGADPNDFSTDFDSETDIAPDESVTVTIYFSPATTTIGNRNAELRIRHDDDNSDNPYTILLTGSVTTTVSDIWVIDNNGNLVKNGLSESNFGTINENDTTAYRTFTIKNSGSANLNINSINISGSQFDLDTSSTASSLAPDNSTTNFRVRFVPNTSGFFSETVTINSNDPEEPNFSFTVSGTALDTGSIMTPRIMIKVDNTGITSGSTIDFGSLRVNSANSPSSETKTISVYNVGSAPLVIGSITSLSGDYTRTNPGSTTIAPGGLTSITVNYNPDDILAPTPHTRTLIVNNNDPLTSSYTLNLTGLAYDPVMVVTNSGTNMGNNASQQTANPTTSSETVTVTNTGNYDLVIQNITATGDTAHFSDTRAGAIGTVPAGGNLQFTVTHEPDTSVNASHSITYTIAGTDPSNLSDTVTFTAGSRVPNINTTTGTLSIGSVALGSSATSNVTLENGGTAPASLEVTGITIGGTNASDFSFDTLNLPITIAPSGTDNSTVLRFTPASPYSPGNRTATLTVNSDDPDTPAFAINVTGTITAPDITSTPPSIVFAAPSTPQTALGDSEQITLTLTNSSASNAQITGVSIAATSVNADEFAITNAPAYPLTLSQGSPNSDIIITFSPVERALDSDDIANRSLVLTVNHDTGPTNFTFSGITVAYPLISLSDTSLGFGDTLVDSTSDRILTVENTGSAPLTITPSITTGSGEYSIISAPMTPIAVGATAAITVRYTATGTTDNQTQTGTLNIVSNDYRSAQKSMNVSLTGTAQYEATCNVTPTSVNFGAIPTGTNSAASVVTITNNGKGDLTIDDITSSDTNFTVTAVSPAVIPEGTNGTFSITYSPAAAGTHAGTITIENHDQGDLNSDVTINLSGEAVAPVIGASISFAGSTPIGDTTPADLEITNGAASVADLVISSVTLSNTTDFEINYTTPLPISIGPGTTNSSIKIIFKPQPTYVASKSTDITIVSNDPDDNPHVISPVNATVTAPDISLTDMSGVAFPNTAVGTTSAAQSFTYTNDGPGTLTISSITLTGTHAADFAIISNPAPVSVPDGSTATVNVTFNPTAAGTRSANINFATDDPDSPLSYAITGTGIQEAVGTVALVGAMPLTAVDSVSAGTALSIQNSGSSALTVYSVISTGTNAADFYATGSFPISIGAGATNNTAVSVFFKPTALGMRETDLEIYSSAPGSPDTISINANANAIIDNQMTSDGLNTGKYSSIDISGTNIYISYYDETNQRLKTAVSNDYGDTFFVSATDTVTGRGKYSQIKSNGTDVFIAYYDETAKDLLFVSSADGGASWGTPVVIDGGTSDCGEHISMARNGTSLYISYYDSTHDMVKLAHSNDNGATWDTYLIDKTTCGGTSVAVSGTTVHVAYYAENSYASLFSIDIEAAAPLTGFNLGGSTHDFALTIGGVPNNITLPANANTTINFIVGEINTAYTPAIMAYNYNDRKVAIFEQTPGDGDGIGIANDIATSVDGVLFTVPTSVADGNASIQELRYAKSTSLHTWDIQIIESGGFGLAPSINADGSNLGVTYVTNDATGTIRYAYSSDNGANWTSYGDLFIPGSTSGDYFGALRFDGSSSALFAFYDEDNQILMFTKGDYDGTGLNSGQVVIDNNTGRGTFPAMVVDGTDVFILYFDDNDQDLMIIKSEDLGNTW